MSQREFRPARRQFLQALTAIPATALVANAKTRKQIPIPNRRYQVVRKSAAQLTDAEIARFKRGYDLIIKNGTLDGLIAGHADMSQEQHEFVPNVIWQTFHLMPYPGGERFLPWHRAFVLELEFAMRRAIYQADGSAEAALVFVPYWDVTHSSGIPTWAAEYIPKGMYAVGVEGLPPGHPGFGKVGARYPVQIQRWPGTYVTSRNLPSKEHYTALLNVADYQSFTRRLEWAPMISRTATASELAQLRQLGTRVADAQQNYALIADVLATGRINNEQYVPLMTAFTRLEGIRMDPNYVPGANQQAATDMLNATMQFYLLGPHNNIHAWAAGHDKLLKGTVLYTHETAAEPLFWMLHCEIDRMWMTWQAKFSATPNLQGKDALFRPWAESRTWTLPEMLNARALSYRYDQLYVA